MGLDINDHGQFSHKQRAASTTVSVLDETPLSILQMLAFSTHQTPFPSASTHPRAISPARSTLWQPQLPLNLNVSPLGSAAPGSACFHLDLRNCCKTTRSALSAITEQTEEAAAWFSRLWGLPFSIIFGYLMIYAAYAHTFSSSLSFLSVFTSCSLLRMVISQIFSRAGPLTQSPQYQMSIQTKHEEVLATWYEDER